MSCVPLIWLENEIDGHSLISIGWKELRFISRDSKMLAFGESFLGLFKRKPQPRTWHDALASRDGCESGASVLINRSTKPNEIGSIMKSESRQLFKQEISIEDCDNFGKEDDENLMALGEVSKEIMIVVKRGKDADLSDTIRSSG